MSRTQVLDFCGRAESNAILSLGVHGLLVERGQVDLARIVWVLHLAAVRNATEMGSVIGVEVTCD